MNHKTRKVALVTGSSRGIGAGIARRLSEAGYAVAVTWAKSEKVAEELASQLGESRAFNLDGGDRASVASILSRVTDHFGRLDVLVNSAGVLAYGITPDLSVEDLDRVYDINVRMPFALVREAAEIIPDGGSVVNIGTVHAQAVPLPGLSAYVMTKTALVGMTRAWARDLAKRGIRVNAVHPGPIDTDMNPKDGPAADFNRPRTALGRYGTVDEVANGVAWLVSSEASYVTGAFLNIDGGYNA